MVNKIKARDLEQTLINLANVKVLENNMIKIFSTFRGDEVHQLLLLLLLLFPLVLVLVHVLCLVTCCMSSYMLYV